MQVIRGRQVDRCVRSLGVLALIGGCGPKERLSTIAYRMTVEVDAPGGLRSGSSVFLVETRAGKRLGDDSGIERRIRTEAVAVRLQTGILFAILKGAAGPDYPAYLLLRGLERGIVTPPLSRTCKGSEWLEMEAEARQVRPRIRLDPRDYPTFVRFRDLADPSSVEAVAPSDLASSSGPACDCAV